MRQVDFTALAWLSVLALALTVALLRARPHERATFLNTLWLFLGGVAGQGAAAALFALDVPRVGGTLHTAFHIVTALALIRMMGFAVFRLLLPFAGKQPTRILEDLALIVVYVGYGFSQLRAAGVDLGSLVTSSAILTAVIAFAMQDTLGNVLGGIAIQLDHSVQVGDWVKAGEVTGRVVDIRWRTTLIETRDWETVMIPNSQLMKSRVEILGRREGAPRQWRRLLDFMVDPGVPPARVISTVEEEMRGLAIANVARTPGATCVLRGFDRGNLCYQLRYFLTEILEDDSTDSRVRVHLFTSLQRAGIRIAEPQHKVLAIQRDEAYAENVKRRELTRRLQALEAVQPFAALSEEERAALAEHLQYSPFAHGDVITRQGNAAHWLYLIAFGEVEVAYEPASGPPQTIATLGTGDVFGEMGILGAGARGATVLARTDVECYRLDRAAFEELLDAHPQIATDMRRLAEARRPLLEQTREAFAAVQSAPPANDAPGFAARIRSFLGLSG